jgi:hypothetical protein
MEHRRWTYRSHTALAMRTVLLLFALLCLSALSKVMLDVVNWRTSTDAARAVAADTRRPVQDYVNAAVVLHRDAIRSVQALRQIADHGGPAAEHARIALQSLADESKR